MKLTKILTVALLGFCLSAQAALYSSGEINQVIPDASLAGWSSSHTFSGLDVSIQDITVTLNLSGGYNGDLYAYLSSGGVLVPLLNRVGVGTGTGLTTFGFSTSGMNLTLGMTGDNIHGIANPLGGVVYQPDGRAISPLGAPSTFDSDGTMSFADYVGRNPNATWTLFLADVSGGAQSTLTSWELDIQAVPEPVDVALGIFGGIALTVAVYRHGGKAAGALRRARKQA